MAIIRWLLLAALLLGFLLLAVANWVPVEFVLPTGRVTMLPLPLLLAGAFLAGVIPTWAWHGLVRPLIGDRRGHSAAPPREQVAVAPPADGAGT
jgi:uncharacterized integral membrane protein